MSAERLVRSRFAAWNRADPIGLRAALHLPHVSLTGARVSIRVSERELLGSADFRALQSVEGWHSSQLDELAVHQASADKAHCVVAFGRNATDGTRYADGQSVCVITNQDGRWGIQLNSVTLRPIGVGADAAAGGEVVAAAEAALQGWLAAWDAGDAAAMRRLAHLPFVRMEGARFAAHRSQASLWRALSASTSGRSWQRSQVIRAGVLERSASKVALEADVARLGPGGSLVRLDPVLVIVTELQGRWAVQVYSSFLTSSTANPRR
jgi:hypothetical protein